MNEEDASDEEDNIWDSGPYCRHWYSTWDCERNCENCGVSCPDHDLEGCDEWEEWTGNKRT